MRGTMEFSANLSGMGTGVAIKNRPVEQTV
jgi:hypothetical protein